MKTRITQLAMAVAGTMLAHQVASKAVREAVFLSGPGIANLPAMVIATAVAVVIAVPGFARLLAAWGPRVVVPAGFALSAVLHLVELRLPQESYAVSVAIYLHVAGFGALLLSSFWSLLSEIFDPRSAKESYGPIAAAGTIGGLVGGLAVLTVPVNQSLLVLAVLHAACAAGTYVIARKSRTSTLSEPSEPLGRLFDREAMRRAPHIATLAILVVLSTASAGVVDYLFKKRVADIASSRAELQHIFAIFYMGVGILTFWAQTGASEVVRRFGLGRAIASLPASLGVTSAATLFAPGFLPLIVATRAAEAVFRGSWFRSGYELLFVPMAPDDKRRVKTFLDVTCDRAGDAAGAAIVQGVVVLAAATPVFLPFVPATLLVITLLIVAFGLVLANRIDGMYRTMIASRLADQVSEDQITIVSDTGWTILDLPAEFRTASTREPVVRMPVAPAAPLDPKIQRMVDLKSGDRTRVEAALRHMSRPERPEVAQMVQLLAWDDLVPLVRLMLERVAISNIGLLEDALIDRETDFAVRRRLPRVMALVHTDRSVAALTRGLEDPRFEVRYQCARALTRILRGGPNLQVDQNRIMAAVERELSVPLQVWQGHRLLDATEPGEEPDWDDPEHGTADRNLEHVFGLLGLILPKEPLKAALRGLRSTDPELRALTLEYFESVLPLSIVVRLYALPDLSSATTSSDDAP